MAFATAGVTNELRMAVRRRHEGASVLTNVLVCTEFGNNVDAAAFAAFIDDGGNVLVAGDSNLGDAISELGNECGFVFSDPGTSVIDYVQNADGDATLVKATNVLNAPLITGGRGNPILFKGVGYAIACVVFFVCEIAEWKA